MNAIRSLAAGLLGLSMAAGLASVRAGDPPPFRLEDRVPADALAFVSLDGFPRRWREALASTKIGALLARPDVESELRPAFELLRSGLARVGVGTALLAKFASSLPDLDGQLAVAVTGVRRDGTPDIVASLDFGAHLSDFAVFVRGIETDPPAGWAAADAVATNDGRRTLRLTTDDATTWQATAVGTTVLLANFAGDPEALPGLAPAATPLSGSPAFAAASATAAADSARVFAYADLAGLIQRELADPSSSFGRGLAKASAIDALTTLSYRAEVEGGVVVESLRLAALKAEKGLFSLFKTQPITSESAPPAPRRTWIRIETSLPFSSFPGRWRSFLHDIDRDDEGEFSAWLARMHHRLGADLETELLPAIVDEQTLWLGASDGGGAVPEIVLSLPVRDASSFEPIFSRAIDGLCVQWTEGGEETATQRSIGVLGRTMHVVERTGSRGHAGPAFSPTWAIVGDRLVLTLVPHTMRALFRRVDHGNGGRRESPAGLASARAAGTAVVVSTSDLLPSAYDTLIPLAEAIPAWRDAARDASFDPVRLPATDDLSGSLSDTVMSLRVGADGVTWSARSPFGVVPMTLVTVAAIQGAHAREGDGDGAEPSLQGVAIAGGSSDDPTEVTRRALDQTARIVEEYVALRGSLPASLDDLLHTERLAASIPLDGWNRAVVFEPRQGATPARLVSAGPDGVLASDDDLVVDLQTPPK